MNVLHLVLASITLFVGMSRALENNVSHFKSSSRNASHSYSQNDGKWLPQSVKARKSQIVNAGGGLVRRWNATSKHWKEGYRKFNRSKVAKPSMKNPRVSSGFSEWNRKPCVTEKKSGDTMKSKPKKKPESRLGVVVQEPPDLREIRHIKSERKEGPLLRRHPRYYKYRKDEGNAFKPMSKLGEPADALKVANENDSDLKNWFNYVRKMPPRSKVSLEQRAERLHLMESNDDDDGENSSINKPNSNDDDKLETQKKNRWSELRPKLADSITEEEDPRGSRHEETLMSSNSQKKWKNKHDGTENSRNDSEDEKLNTNESYSGASDEGDGTEEKVTDDDPMDWEYEDYLDTRENKTVAHPKAISDISNFFTSDSFPTGLPLETPKGDCSHSLCESLSPEQWKVLIDLLNEKLPQSECSVPACKPKCTKATCPPTCRTVTCVPITTPVTCTTTTTCPTTCSTTCPTPPSTCKTTCPTSSRCPPTCSSVCKVSSSSSASITPGPQFSTCKSTPARCQTPAQTTPQPMTPKSISTSCPPKIRLNDVLKFSNQVQRTESNSGKQSSASFQKYTIDIKTVEPEQTQYPSKIKDSSKKFHIKPAKTELYDTLKNLRLLEDLNDPNPHKGNRLEQKLFKMEHPFLASSGEKMVAEGAVPLKSGSAVNLYISYMMNSTEHDGEEKLARAKKKSGFRAKQRHPLGSKKSLLHHH